jgi:hypothetical protein
MNRPLPQLLSITEAFLLVCVSVAWKRGNFQDFVNVDKTELVFTTLPDVDENMGLPAPPSPRFAGKLWVLSKLATTRFGSWHRAAWCWLLYCTVAKREAECMCRGLGALEFTLKSQLYCRFQRKPVCIAPSLPLALKATHDWPIAVSDINCA